MVTVTNNDAVDKSKKEDELHRELHMAGIFESVNKQGENVQYTSSQGHVNGYNVLSKSQNPLAVSQGAVSATNKFNISSCSDLARDVI